MPIDTTLYIHENTLKLISESCDMSGISHNRLIVMLLKNAMGKARKNMKTGLAIRYQERNQGGHWHTVHVRFREDEADFFKDMRNFMKMSVSLILAQAAREYLKEMVRASAERETTDNYPFSNHQLSFIETNDGIFWITHWKTPPPPSPTIKH